MEAARFPQPLATVGWAVVSLRERDDGGNQLMSQVLRQLQDGPDQSKPAVLRGQNTDRHDRSWCHSGSSIITA